MHLRSWSRWAPWPLSLPRVVMVASGGPACPAVWSDLPSVSQDAVCPHPRPCPMLFPWLGTPSLPSGPHLSSGPAVAALMGTASGKPAGFCVSPGLPVSQR